jgi:hypothetical protein
MEVAFDQDCETELNGFIGEIGGLDYTLDIILELNVDLLILLTLIPYPNTSLFYSMESDDRLLTKDWDKYDGAHVVFQPCNLSPRELQEGCLHILKVFYSTKNLVRRVFNWGIRSFEAVPLSISTGCGLIRRLERAMKND